MHGLAHMSETVATYMNLFCEYCIIIVILCALVQSELDYASVAWNTITLTDSFKLERIQGKCSLMLADFLLAQQ
jgi:hypothetical protein